MKKNSFVLMKFAVGLTILIGVLLILFANDKSFKKIIADDIENISRLSSATIYAEIDNSLTKPIFVGQTMANDLFLKNWLAEEPMVGEASIADSSARAALMQEYLSEYSKKYGYDSVSVISANSNIYYYQDGINKIVDRNNPHDIWYYTFIESDMLYDLDVDTDEVNSDQLTVFVNCKISDNTGNLLGVVGVGIKMSNLQSLLNNYETQYNLKAFMIDENGLVQVDSVNENIETVNFFESPEIHDLENKILSDKANMQIFWYPEDGLDHCLITKYVENLNWYIIIDKNNSLIQQMLTTQIHQDLLFVSVIIVLVLLMISYIIGKYNRMLLRTATIDDVTNLPNTKMFQEIYNRNTRRAACHQCTVFIFDIDHFKGVNDRFGHLFGNTVLYRISEITKEVIGTNGIVARWGGDEFVGVIYGTPEDAGALFALLADRISAMQEGSLDMVTISLGAVNANNSTNLDLLIEAADKAMYLSKENGRNRITFSDSVL